MSFVNTLKIALENSVLCARTNPAKDSYEYAERMEHAVRNELKKDLEEIIKNDTFLVENLKEFINNL